MLLLTFVAGCGCETDLDVKATPREKALRIGEGFTPELEYRSCGTTQPLPDVVTWQAQDTAIVLTDSRTGATIGRSIGTTLVIATGEKFHQLRSIPVTVTP